MPELVLKLGDSVLQNFVFDKDVMSIGRSRDNDIVVENLSVSRNHARIRRQAGKYILTDLNSANGTYVNGVRVSKTEIVNDDVIAIGKHKLHFADEQVDEEKMIADAFGADRTVVVDRAPAPVICISDGKLKGQEFPITKFETTVGKAPSNDVVLGDDWFLAKKQAVIIRRGNNEYEIHDMGGFRRTKVNGVQLAEPVVLQAGDVIEFGNTRCVFQFSGEGGPIPSGRVPQEMALEDSIFSTGVSYENEAPAHEQQVETPFFEEAPAAALSESESDGMHFDAGAMARDAIEADEKARADARLQTPLSVTPVPFSYGNGNHDEVPARVPREQVYAEASAASVDMSSMDEVPGAEEEPAAELQQAEPAEHELPTSVYGVSEDPDAALVEAHAVGAETKEMPYAPGLPVMPSTAQAAPSPVVSASGGRSSRKKKRDKDRQSSPSAPAPPSVYGDLEPAAPVEEKPNFEERPPDAEVQPQGGQEEAQESSPVAEPLPGTESASSEEIKLWESALTNRSSVIRKQAARMLKKLTGRDYEV